MPIAAGHLRKQFRGAIIAAGGFNAESARSERRESHFGWHGRSEPHLTDPDDARRARAEADYQTHRAIKLASDNDEVKKLREEVVKLLQINSD
jgi:hypothetical protein